MQIDYWVNSLEQMEEAVVGMVFQDSNFGCFRFCGDGLGMERFGSSYAFTAEDMELPARLIAVSADINW